MSMTVEEVRDGLNWILDDSREVGVGDPGEGAWATLIEHGGAERLALLLLDEHEAAHEAIRYNADAEWAREHLCDDHDAVNRHLEEMR